MKRLFGALVILILTSTVAKTQEILVNGIYQGENLFVMNPFAATGVGFCVYEVNVNDKVTTDEINSSAFEIDLSMYQLQVGDKVNVIIKHKDGCLPKVLNPEVLQTKSTFKIIDIAVDRKNNTLKWSTTNEKGPLPFQVEQYKWKKWVNIGTVNGKGTPGANEYSVEINAHSGLNKFMVKQIDSPEVTFSPEKPKNEIKFSAITNYEVYDFYGRLISKGRGSVIDISKYKKGDFFINYDNSMGQFSKK